MSRLFVFDMDGTILPKTTASLEIARVTNTTAQLTRLEEQFNSGGMDTKAFAREIYKLWGIPNERVIDEAFQRSAKLENIDTVINIINARGDHTCLITMSPDFFAHCFKRLGFGHVYASQFPKDVSSAFNPDRILTPEDKLTITKTLCAQLGVEFVDVVAFGDSMSDVPLFRHLVHTVAVNGTDQLRRMARYSYVGNDLLELFRINNYFKTPNTA